MTRKLFILIVTFFAFCIHADGGKILHSNKNNTLFNKPYIKPAIGSVDGFVWFDSNVNGYFDIGEDGIANVPVFLFTCSGQFIASTISDSDGSYDFSDIEDGSYKVFFNKSGLPNNYSFTLSGDDALDNDAYPTGFTDCFDLFEDELEQNAGFTILSNIGDFVWYDYNGDGIQDFLEPGISGVTVNLFDQSGILLDEQITDPNGYYNFSFLFPGSYYLQFIAADSLTVTYYNGFDQGDDSDISGTFGPGTTSLITIAGGEDRLDIDAGYYECVNICGFVYADANFNDNKDQNENGFNGLMVMLWQLTDDGPELVDATFTANQQGTNSNDGYYSFCVAPGTYYVQVILSPTVDLVPGLPFIGNNEQTYNSFDESNGPFTTYTFSLLGGEEACPLNLGLYCGGKFTNSVWLDTNFDGIKDENEPPVQGILVELFDDSFNKIGQSITNEEGVFTIEKLRKDSYYLQFSKPEAYVFTLPFADGGSSSIFDCDVDNSFGEGTTSLYSLGGCEIMRGLNAGYTSGALPVKWENISVKGHNKSNVLDWKTNSEFHSDYYEVMRSDNNGKSFTVIGKIKSLNNPTGGSYSFVDSGIKDSNIKYYRIKHVGMDNSVSYSSIVSVLNTKGEHTIKITPNPANSFLNITFSNSDNRSDADILLLDNVGKKVKEYKISATENSEISLDISELQPGLYFTQITLGTDFRFFEKLLIVR
ncbi:MAG: T9SS type A sorting domain-containing protein [Saprospiraceae bacterium]|nr:T9SS type A sorting domain-containing protein [Saprospiraceae bacterium]